MRCRGVSQSSASDGRAEVFQTRREFTDGLSPDVIKALSASRLRVSAPKSPSPINNQFDLFSVRPGSKTGGTSAQAAREVERSGRAVTLKEKVIEELTGDALTADEIAANIGETVLSIRPRVAYLAKDGIIVDTGQRRANESGKQATVWRLK